jgi:hypothetical protein
VGGQKVGEDGGVALSGEWGGGWEKGVRKGERGKGRAVIEQGRVVIEQAALLSSFKMPLNLIGAQQVYLNPKP